MAHRDPGAREMLLELTDGSCRDVPAPAGLDRQALPEVREDPTQEDPIQVDLEEGAPDDVAGEVAEPEGLVALGDLRPHPGALRGRALNPADVGDRDLEAGQRVRATFDDIRDGVVVPQWEPLHG